MATKKTSSTKAAARKKAAKPCTIKVVEDGGSDNSPRRKTSSTSGGKTHRKTKTAPKEKRLSAINAAAKVLAETGEPMNAKQLIETIVAKGYWTSPAGKTPHATLYSAILREIKTKGNDARFTKSERGKFAIKA